MIYVINAIGTNLYKIGFSARENYGDRLNELQTGSPHDLELLLWLDGTMDEEKYLHDSLNAFRYRREWFELDRDRLFLVLLSCLLRREVKYRFPHEKSKKVKERWGAMWTPEFFVKTYYDIDYDKEFSAETGVKDDELWAKYAEHTSGIDGEINTKKKFVSILNGSHLAIPRKTINGNTYYNLTRKFT